MQELSRRLEQLRAMPPADAAEELQLCGELQTKVALSL
jgi:hypothetical protein